MERTTENGHRVLSGCAITGFIHRKGKRASGETILRSIAVMRDRSNGLGGGFAAYGIYPHFRDHYALHLMYDNDLAREVTEKYLRGQFVIDHAEPIPTRPIPEIRDEPLLWRYFAKPRPEAMQKRRPPWMPTTSRWPR